jgi:hypothetical protein
MAGVHLLKLSEDNIVYMRNMRGEGQAQIQSRRLANGLNNKRNECATGLRETGSHGDSP